MATVAMCPDSQADVSGVGSVYSSPNSVLSSVVTSRGKTYTYRWTAIRERTNDDFVTLTGDEFESSIASVCR
jgi:hypothetical protein